MASVLYDFSWDDQADLGVWVRHGNQLVCVEAHILERVEDADEFASGWQDLWSPLGEYEVCGGDLPPDAGVLLPGGDRPLFGFAAKRAWAKLARICAASPQVPVSQEQAEEIGWLAWSDNAASAPGGLLTVERDLDGGAGWIVTQDGPDGRVVLARGAKDDLRQVKRWAERAVFEAAGATTADAREALCRQLRIGPFAWDDAW